MKKSLKNTIVQKEVLQVIQEKYHEIFSAEQKVADYVLAHPQSAVDPTVFALASLSGVSASTVIRFCHDLGYTGYYQFRITLSRDLGRQQGMAPGQDINAIDKIFNEYEAATRNVKSSLSYQDLLPSIELMKNARTVHLVAAGNTCHITGYMGFRLERMGIRSTYSPVPEYYINHINLSEQGDILVAISKSGLSKSVIQVMELAKERGLKIIAITSCLPSPVSNLAHYTLNCGEPQGNFSLQKSYSYLHEFILVEMLLSLLTAEDFPRSLEEDPEFLLSEYKL